MDESMLAGMKWDGIKVPAANSGQSLWCPLIRFAGQASDDAPAQSPSLKAYSGNMLGNSMEMMGGSCVHACTSLQLCMPACCVHNVRQSRHLLTAFAAFSLGHQLGLVFKQCRASCLPASLHCWLLLAALCQCCWCLADQHNLLVLFFVASSSDCITFSGRLLLLSHYATAIVCLVARSHVGKGPAQPPAVGLHGAPACPGLRTELDPIRHDVVGLQGCAPRVPRLHDCGQ